MTRYIIPLVAIATTTCRLGSGFTAIPRQAGLILRNKRPRASNANNPLSTLQATLAAPIVNMTDMGFQTPVDVFTNLPTADPSAIEIVPLEKHSASEEALFEEEDDTMYPFVNMLRGSGRYIADHRGEVCVFHIPGELLDSPGFGALVDDIALAWLLGLKIVLVAGCRYDVECCSLGFESGQECRNTLHVTDDKLLRYIEEEAGYVRFELERQLNRSLRLHGGMSKVDPHSPLPSGNVVGGNFFTAKPYGVVHGKDYQNSGYPSHINSEKIQEVLKRDDIVLLTTVGCSRLGSCVNVNGNHLAAFVAASLDAHKLVYFANQGTVLAKQGEQEKTIQDLPLSLAKSFLDYHKVKVHRAGFASFSEAKEENLDASSIEMLLHLGWGSWALDSGVRRAHIVNPGDGALLEELYTAKHGTNTCLYREDDKDEFDDDDDLSDLFDSLAPWNQHDEILFSELPNGN